MGYCFNLNHSDTIEIAVFDTVFFCRDYNFTFQEVCFSVMDVMKDETHKNFYFPVGDFIEERKAYEKAARYYNSLVPDGEEIPLF